MRLDQSINNAMAMDDETWARHANPWSVWTRLAAIPAFALAVYARVWIGWWCLIPIGLIVIFLWLNTRIFAKATTDERWETRAIRGEQLWLARKENPIPEHHNTATFWIVFGSCVAIVPLAVGLVMLDPWAVALGVAGMFFGQLWFLDRLAWLYAETHNSEGK